jgi:hypothetical protein
VEAPAVLRKTVGSPQPKKKIRRAETLEEAAKGAEKKDVLGIVGPQPAMPEPRHDTWWENE